MANIRNNKAKTILKNLNKLYGSLKVFPNTLLVNKIYFITPLTSSIFKTSPLFTFLKKRVSPAGKVNLMFTIFPSVR